MSVYNITSRYANALLELADGKSLFNEISADSDLIYNTFDASPDLRTVISSPVIREDKKISILTEIFSDRTTPDTLKFIRFVIDKNREVMLFDIIKRFRELRDEKLGIVNIDLTSALPLSENQKDEMNSVLKKYTQKEINIDYKIEDDIIGGFLAKIGDTVLDASVSNQLTKLKKQLMS